MDFEFINFCTIVDNRFQTKLKIIQSDEGAKFKSGNFSKFLKDNGISSRLSCPKWSSRKEA